MTISLSRARADRAAAGAYSTHSASAAPFRKRATLTSGRQQREVQYTRSVDLVRHRISFEGSVQATPAGGPSGLNLDVGEAWRLLLQFNEADMQAQRSSGTVRSTTREQRDALRAAVQVAVSHAWPEAGWDPAARPARMMLGVLSGDVRLAVRALRDYAHALGFDFVMPQSKVPGQMHLSSISGGVYIKHNVCSSSATVSEYTGSHRGVLLQLGQQQIGHLPLGLFDEAKSVPPPCIS